MTEVEKTKLPVEGHVSSGSAWGFIVDRAQLEICKYLGATVAPFDIMSPLAVSMLSLLDQSALKEIVLERNFNKLCGNIGCSHEPSGMVRIVESSVGDAQGELSKDWFSYKDGNDDDNEEAIEETADGGEEEAEHAIENSKEKGKIIYDVNEIVYDDDIFTAQTFRIAERQIKQLNRMRNLREQHDKRLLIEKAKQGNVGECAGERFVPVGVSKEERFCGVECLAAFEEIQSRVKRYMEVGDPNVLPAIAHLFPKLDAENVRKLASLEKDSTSKMLKQEVVEKQIDVEKVEANAVQVGVNYEVEPGTVEKPLKNTTEGPGIASPSLRNLLQSMEALQHVWQSETSHHFPIISSSMQRNLQTVPSTNVEQRENTSKVAVRAPEAAVPEKMKETETQKDDELEREDEEEEEDDEDVIPVIVPLKGIYFALDFIMQLSSTNSRNLLFLHYLYNRTAILEQFELYEKKQSYFTQLIKPVKDSLEKKVVKMCATETSGSGNSSPLNWSSIVTKLSDSGVHTGDPFQREERVTLFTSNIFGAQNTNYVANLLLADPAVLRGAAWDGVWGNVPVAVLKSTVEVQRRWRAQVPISALSFSFAIRGAMLQPSSASVEMLIVSLLFLLAAALVSPSKHLWSVLCGDTLPELTEVLSLNDSDVRAGVRSILLDEEDD